MKKTISLILCVLLSVAILTGCNLFTHDYERDYAQVIVTISPIETKNSEQRVKRDQTGMPVKDVDGEIVMEKSDKFGTVYTSPEIKIYKSQLVNYVNYYLNEELSNSVTQISNLEKLQAAVEKFLNELVSNELLLAEADRLFDAGVLYWTVDEVEEIQRSVYTAISDQIFSNKNELLKAKNLPELAEKGGDPSTGETTYPIDPSETETEDLVSPAYPVTDSGTYQWFDDWYTEDDWYIRDSVYANSYPGLYGTLRDKSLASEAFTMYLDTMIENSENIIAATDAQNAIIKEEVAEINRIRNTQGVEYVYPMLGKTLMIKLLVGNSYIKNQKLVKLENYITQDKTTVTQQDVTAYYNRLLSDQKINFATESKYDSAVSDKQTILYTPSDRYVFVKHILLPFSDEQTAELNKIKTKYGASNTNISEERKKLIETERAKLARQIKVYTHTAGENDLTIPQKSVATVTKEITLAMNNLRNNARAAERMFDHFIYKYNTDPGIFGNEKGYAVVYKLNEGESETYMVEFANAARAFRDDGYSIGDIYYDDEITDESGNPVPYIITDYGIHIMYYCLDPQAGEEKLLSDYVTPGRYNKINDLMETAALEKVRTDAYSDWKLRYVSDTKERNATIKQNLIDKYIKELNKLIYG